MNLELKHLAPYLAYGLTGITIHTSHYCTLTGLGRRLGKTFDYEIKVGSGHIHKCAGLSNFKPILSPLSDLTKEKVNELFGEKYDSVDCMMYEGTLSFNAKDYDSINLIHQIPRIEKLYEHHFDVFGLIEKGLAIDINRIT